MSTGVCRHGFRPRECLAADCENAEKPPTDWPPKPPQAPPKQPPAPPKPPPTSTKAEPAPNPQRGRRLGRLTESEAAAARRLVEEHGIDRACKMLGIADPSTLTKAIAQFNVSHLTAGTIRYQLERRRSREQTP